MLASTPTSCPDRIMSARAGETRLAPHAVIIMEGAYNLADR